MYLIRGARATILPFLEGKSAMTKQKDSVMLKNDFYVISTRDNIAIQGERRDMSQGKAVT